MALLIGLPPIQLANSATQKLPVLTHFESSYSEFTTSAWGAKQITERNNMKSLVTILAFAVLPNLALADSKWIGTGEEFSPDGTSISTYQIVVANTDLSAGVTMSQATVTYPDGSQHVTNQKITQSNKGWSVESDFGKGGGSCYGKDFCENYIQGENGAAIATTIVEDGDTARRDISFLLDNCKAVKIFKDKLTKVQQ